MTFEALTFLLPGFFLGGGGGERGGGGGGGGRAGGLGRGESARSVAFL